METYYINKMEIVSKDDAVNHIMDTFLALKFSINDASDMMEEDFRNLSILCYNCNPTYYIGYGNQDILEYKKYLLAEYKSDYYVWDTDLGFQLSSVVLSKTIDNNCPQPCCKCNLNDKWNSLGEDNKWYCYQHCKY